MRAEANSILFNKQMGICTKLKTIFAPPSTGRLASEEAKKIRALSYPQFDNKRQASLASRLCALILDRPGNVDTEFFGGMQWPIGVPQHCSRQKHGIRISTNKGLLRLLRICN